MATEVASVNPMAAQFYSECTKWCVSHLIPILCISTLLNPNFQESQLCVTVNTLSFHSAVFFLFCSSTCTPYLQLRLELDVNVLKFDNQNHPNVVLANAPHILVHFMCGKSLKVDQ